MPRRVLPIALALLSAAPAAAQLPASTEAADTSYVRYTAMIPMRDGVRLNTEIFVPKRASGRLPILLTRTPYGVGPSVITAAGPGRALHELAQDGYVFVAQDLRGRFKSEGQFVMQRAPRDRKVKGAVDEASDAYDTVDWLVKHVPNNNGRAGIFGVSYAGWTAAMALLDPHPALRASSPQASPADMFLGDDFHHNGAFRLSYGFEYATMMETGKEVEQFKFDTYDTYDWYLKLGPLSNATTMLQGKIPTWNDFARHADYDEFWKRQTIVRYLTKPLTVPTLNVAGWWDQEDFYGPFAIYQALEKQDRQGKNHLVVGPWNHGGWNRSEGKTLGKIDFGGPTSVYFRERIQAPFFRCHLHGRCESAQPEAVVFESGANEWRTYDAWPPKQGIQQRALYFGPNGMLSWAPPGGAASGDAVSGAAGASPAGDSARAYDEFVSDPSKPVPYRPRPIEPTYDERGSGWGAWQVEDQRFVHNRPDVLSWATEPLTEDVTIAGDVLAEMFASTTGSDADWVVKLIDVYPDLDTTNVKMSGYQLMVSGEVFRARYRNSFEKPEALVPNQPTPVKFGLHGQAYRFKKGHRIMVQVQSSWFPVIDRNPQTFVPNIFEAKAGDFRAAAHRVFRSADMPSHLTLPVKEPFRPVSRYPLRMAAAALVAAAAPLGAQQAAPEHDVVIRNGRVLDGAGNPWIVADVAIRGGRFVQIGTVRGRGRTEIDARGKYVSPGWIDMMDQSGSVLPRNPLAENKLGMGVTTAIGGEGGTPVPASEIPAYFQRLETQGISINFGTYFSQTQARIPVLGRSARAPTAPELERMRAIMDTAMRAGAMGMTTALIYPPSSYAKTDELAAVAQVAGRHGGLYASHIRGEGADVVAAVREAIAVGEQGGLPVEIFHLKVAHRPGWGTLMAEVRDTIEAARARGVDVAADMYVYTAGGTGLEATIPSWAHEGGTDSLKARLALPAVRARFKRELQTGSPGWWNIVEAAGGWDGVVLANARDPKSARYHGRSIADIAREMGKDPADAAWDLVAAGSGRVMAIYHMMGEPDIETALRFPWTSIGSDAGAALQPGAADELGLPHPRSYGNHARVISRYVRERKVLTLEDAVRKMTSWPATRMRLAGRGAIQVGNWADVTIFDLATIDDRATYDAPTRSPTGIEWVLVNGVVVMDHGRHTGAKPGKVLRGPGAQPVGASPSP